MEVENITVNEMVSCVMLFTGIKESFNKQKPNYAPLFHSVYEKLKDCVKKTNEHGPIDQICSPLALSEIEAEFLYKLVELYLNEQKKFRRNRLCKNLAEFEKKIERSLLNNFRKIGELIKSVQQTT